VAFWLLGFFYVHRIQQQETFAAFRSSINTKTPHPMSLELLPGFFYTSIRSPNMIILRNPQQLSQITQPETKTFLRRRFDDICAPEPYDPDEHGFFILVEPSDTSERIESATGYCWEY
jgi:hypothetical protein